MICLASISTSSYDVGLSASALFEYILRGGMPSPLVFPKLVGDDLAGTKAA